MFDPALAGYWVGAGGLASDPDHARATDVCARVINDNAAKVNGVKVSLLDAERKSRCARACREASACTRATTSTLRR